MAMYLKANKVTSVSMPATYAIFVSLLAMFRGSAAFSTYAGSCDHAGVQHGLDMFVAQVREFLPTSSELSFAEHQTIASLLDSRDIRRMDMKMGI